jgi:cytochrome P450
VKYVIMFTFDPELDAQVPADRMQDLYGRANQWYGDNAAQIGFGDGIHVCLGAPLVHRVAPTALNVLLKELPVLKLAGTPQWQTDPYLRSVANLPVGTA